MPKLDKVEQMTNVYKEEDHLSSFNESKSSVQGKQLSSKNEGSSKSTINKANRSNYSNKGKIDDDEIANLLSKMDKKILNLDKSSDYDM